MGGRQERRGDGETAFSIRVTHEIGDARHMRYQAHVVWPTQCGARVRRTLERTCVGARGVGLRQNAAARTPPAVVATPSMYIWSTHPSSETAWKMVTNASMQLSYESAPLAGFDG